MNKIIFTSEHELKEKYNDEWSIKLSELSHKADLHMYIPCSEDINNQKELKEIAEGMPIAKEILLYEECVEKGGGGADLLPSISEFITSALIIVVPSTIAVSFISEIGKDLYKGLRKRLINLRRRLRYRGKFIFRLITEDEALVDYIIPKFLSDDEYEEAFHAMKEHFLALRRGEIEYQEYYIYDRLSKNWLLF